MGDRHAELISWETCDASQGLAVKTVFPMVGPRPWSWLQAYRLRFWKCGIKRKEPVPYVASYVLGGPGRIDYELSVGVERKLVQNGALAKYFLGRQLLLAGEQRRCRRRE